MATARTWQRTKAVSFGRRTPFVGRNSAVQAQGDVADDVRLFVMFFIGGLTFMSVYLA